MWRIQTSNFSAAMLLLCLLGCCHFPQHLQYYEGSRMERLCSHDTTVCPSVYMIYLCKCVCVCGSEQYSHATLSAIINKVLSLMAPGPSPTELPTLMDIQNNAFDVFVHTCNWSLLATGSQLAFNAWLQLWSGSDNKLTRLSSSIVRYSPPYPSRHSREKKKKSEN